MTHLCVCAVTVSPDTAGPSRPGTSGKRKKKGADPDSEEERWLDALEEGNLEQVSANFYNFCPNLFEWRDLQGSSLR